MSGRQSKESNEESDRTSQIFIKDILRNGSQWLSAMELLVIKLGGSQNVPLVGPFEHRMTISRDANETEKEGL